MNDDPIDPRHPASDPTLLNEIVARDYGTCLVFNLDDPGVRPRIVRLSLRDAARWCYITGLGSYNLQSEDIPRLIEAEDGWVCGNWHARRMNVQKRKR